MIIGEKFAGVVISMYIDVVKDVACFVI